MRGKEPKWPFWGQNAIFGPLCDFLTVPSTVPSCTVMTVPKFRNDNRTSSFTASTVRPYFDGPYRHTVIAQPWLIYKTSPCGQKHARLIRTLCKRCPQGQFLCCAAGVWFELHALFSFGSPVAAHAHARAVCLCNHRVFMQSQFKCLFVQSQSVCANTECLGNHRSSVCLCNHRVFVQSQIKCLCNHRVYVQSQSVCAITYKVFVCAITDQNRDAGQRPWQRGCSESGAGGEGCIFRLLFLQAAISSGCFRLSASGYCFFRLLFLQTASGCLLQAAVSSGCFRVSASCCCFFRLVVSVSVTLL